MKLTTVPTYHLELSAEEMELLATFIAHASTDTIRAVMLDSRIPERTDETINVLERIESEWMAS